MGYHGDRQGTNPAAEGSAVEAPGPGAGGTQAAGGEPVEWVAVVATKPSGQALARQLVPWLDRRGVRVVDLSAADGPPRPPGRWPRGRGLGLSLGGDGTLLRAARLVPAEVPLLGVNLGRVGFLTELGPAEVWDVLPDVLRGRFVLDERRVLEGMVDGEALWAVNDLVVRSGATARLLRLRVRVDDQLAAEVAGDGIVVATATGSTAYALAAGGPAVPPDLECLVVVPLSAFTLAVRPFLLAPQRHVAVELLDGEAAVTADGQETRPLSAGGALRAGLGRRRLRLVRRHPWPFYEVMRAKLFTPPEGGGRR